MRFRLLLFFLFFSLASFAQENPYRDSLLKILPGIKADTERVNTLNRLADNYKDSVNVKKYTSEAIALSEKISYKKGEGVAYGVLGNFYARKQIDNVKSVQNYTQSLKLRDEAGDKKGMAQCYLQLAIIDSKFKNYPKAISLLHIAISLNKEIDNQKGISVDEQAIAQVYMQQERWDSAMYFYKRTLTGPGVTMVTTAVTYINMVSALIGMGELDTALLYIHKTDSIYAILKNDFGPLWNKMNLGQICLLRGDVKNAIINLETAYNYGEKTHNADLLLNVLPTLIEAYRKAGDPEKGFKVQTEWIHLNDSLQDLDKANSVLGEQVKYELDEQKKIQDLKEEKTKAQNEAKSERMMTIIYSVSAILLLVMVLAFFIFRNYREKKKANEIISKQKEMVEEKQREIVDSITYAKRLQDAILPPAEMVKRYFPESFILYLPKDIVAGDFYWMEPAGNAVFIAAADCTGHGVPGAMVSVVCSNALNRAVKEFGLIETGKILDKTRELVIETFEKSGKDVKDGMDISLLCAQAPNSQLPTPNYHWSGAHNPLWMLKKGKIEEIRADKQPVGKQENAASFTTNALDVSAGEMIYLFTDGYADQFGGPKGKKFRYKQLEELLIAIGELPMEEQKQKLENAFLEWKGGLEQIDDVCIIGIRI